ncbi:MAG: hypothetical protein FJX74_10310 [Armatimonadetes bacterium]|nr:hypothetical protein [Armatimonadota bacterium]
MPHSRRQPSRPRWKTALLGCGIGCGSALLLGALAALIVFHKLTAVPPEIARVSAPEPTPQPGQPIPEPPPPYETQRRQAEQAARSGVPTPVTVRLTEGQINDLIAQNAGQDAEVQNVRVAFTGGDLLLTGTTNWRGRHVYVSALGRPQAVGGRPHFQLHSVRVGTLGMPAAGVARLQAEIDRGMADWAAKNPYDVTDVSVYGGQLVLSGTTRPQ